jgi:hypothetical protein
METYNDSASTTKKLNFLGFDSVSWNNLRRRIVNGDGHPLPLKPMDHQEANAWIRLQIEQDGQPLK